MDCTAAMEAISNALDGELSPELQAQLDAHLAQCPRCRVLQAELSGISLACQEALDVPPPELKERIMENLPPQTAVKPVIRLRRQRWVAMAAAFAVVAVGAWQAVRLTQNSTVDTESSAAADATMYVVTDGAPAPEPRAVIEDVPGDAIPEAADVELSVAGAIESDTSDAAAGGAAAAKTASIDTAGANKEDDAQPAAETYDAGQPVSGDEVQGEPAQLFSADAPVLFSARRGLDSGEPTYTDRAQPEPDKSDWTPEVPPDANLITVPEADWEGETAAEVTPTYCGVLTLTQAEWTEEYPKEVKDDGSVWYYLPAQDFRELVSGLITPISHEQLPFFTYQSYRYYGEDISPDSDFGLVIVENQD